MFNMTVKDASKALNVGKSRIHQLIQSGTLQAEKIGNMWLIDDASVLARKKKTLKSGRPSKNAAHENQIEHYVLMNREHEILTFTYNMDTNEFLDAEEIFDGGRAPMSVMSARGVKASAAELTSWWNHRTIPKTRVGIEQKLKALGLGSAFQLPFKSFGLSLSDQYWVRPIGVKLKWKDINFFNNDFAEAPTQEWLVDVGLDSPDNTSDGVLSKRWICEKRGKRVLLKGGGRLNQEPFNEVIATELCKRLLSPADFVSYTLREWGDEHVSACPLFLTDSEEYIPAYYVQKLAKPAEHHDLYRQYVDVCYDLGVQDIETALSKMLVVDFIMANTDRHMRNFGLVRDVESLQYRPVPIFDTGTSLWCHLETRNMRYDAAYDGVGAPASYWCDTRPFSEDERRQLQLVKDVDWLDLSALEGFPEWAVDFLDQNFYMRDRLDFIFEGLNARIDYLRMMFE